MEMFLKELGLASKILSDFQDMYEYENRLKTFTNWPFTENCKCTPENMAKAGFVHCPNANRPDVAKCFFCLIELESWEPNDDPWEEHTKRHSCGFLSLTKHLDDLTMEEYYMLEMTRLRTFLQMCFISWQNRKPLLWKLRCIGNMRKANAVWNDAT
ncbi:baculoviral IAP repeat-containing protein 5.1 isoform X2 [Columba livia]|uniref:baculoviral IAP repeat-containing protein 5.1 isoform X2 n=1 Tax=Columba livia TaxID=8932 RepID=UPI000A3C0B09|nr:baculoviral IAP repeat-containing protein 5.1 isoform X2 [Columba livia]